MRLFEGICLWSTIGFFLLSFVLSLISVIFKKERLTQVSWWGCIAGFGMLTAAIAIRWIESGHPPVLWSFEHSLAGAWFIVSIFLIVGKYFPNIRIACVVVAPLLLLTLGRGIMGRDLGIEPLPPPYQSNWLWVHVFFAWMAYGAFIVSAVLAVWYLIRERSLDRNEASLESLDDLIFKIILFGFITLTVEVGAGAIWAYGLWGRYWAWDPIETWSLITWLIYGANIHLRVTYNWKGKRAVILAILSLIAVIITFGGIGFVGGVHTLLL